jgi:hypothetical protein
VTARYTRELRALGLTYEAARAWDVTALARPLERTLNSPLAVIGSGGSFSVAAYCAGLHRLTTGVLARALTPLSFLDMPAGGETALLCVSASGQNADIIAAFERGLEEELRPAIGVHARRRRPVAGSCERLWIRGSRRWSRRGRGRRFPRRQQHSGHLPELCPGVPLHRRQCGSISWQLFGSTRGGAAASVARRHH